MDKAKELVTTLTAHLPEWCAEWIPDVDQWQWQQWHPADLWQWARTREWRVPELPRWGEDRRLVPEWIFPSYWRKRVRETVLWVWLIFITFLATREERAQREVGGSQLKNDSGADDQQQKILTVPEEGEEEEDDEDTGAWRGGLERPGGLTRYPGIENLLAQPPTATPPPPRRRPPPPVAATQVSNKQILPKPDETQSRKNESREGENEESGEKNHQDEVWKTLLAKYGTEECVRETDKAAEEDDEEEVPEYVGTAEEIVERYSAKFEEPRQDMSPEEEFSAKVGRRLEEYLERLDEDDEESSQAKEVEHKKKGVEQTEKKVKPAEDKTESEEARDIEDGGERLEGITSNGNENRIFIVIEDEESEDDRRNLNDISECSEISQALETQDAEVKDEGQLEEEMKKLSSLQNGLSSEAEPQAETAMETVPEASGIVNDCEEIVEQAADSMLLETPNEAAEGMKDELKDDIVNVPEEQPSDATMEEKGKEMEEEYTKGGIEKIPDTLTTYVAEDRTEESLKLSSREEVKLEEDAEVTSIEPPKEQVETVEQEYTEQTSSQPPEEVKEEEVQTLATAEEVSERHDNVSEDVIMKEQDSIESEALATRHEAQEKTIEDKAMKEEEEEKDKQIKENETLEDKEKETLEIKAATDVSVEENKVVEQETANKDAREDEKVLETEIYVKPAEDVRKEAVEEEKKQEVEAEVTEDEEKEVPADKAAGVAITEPPAVVEEIQVDEEAHFEDGKTEESKDEAMVVEEHMEDEQVPVASVEGWTQDVWGTLGQAPGEAVPLVPPAAIDMMEEDTEDVMDVDVEDEVGETMEEDLEVFVDDVDLRELPESPVPLPTVPEEEDHLAEVQDLLVRPPPRKHRRRQRQEEELADTKGINEAAAAADPSLAKYMTMPHALSPEEEEELRKYLAESGDAKDLSVDKFMSMPAALTEQEQNELEEAVRERERVRQAESAGLDRFLDMPVGLTEQEIRELKDLEREKEEAAEQPWERGDVGFEDYLSMPHTLTEEEERMLQEGEEDEEDRQFASEEEYREYVKNKFLSQLEEDALRMAEEDYDYDEDYDDEYEYEDDEEYEDEEENEDEDEGEMEGEYVMVSDLAAASNLPQAAAASAAATAAPAKMVDEAVNTELNDPKEDAKSKKKPFPFPKKGEDRETTPEDSNVAAQKKFFHFGSLGTKRKKETPDFLDKKSLGNPNGRKFDGGSGGGGGSLSAAFCTVGDQVTRVVLQKLKRQGKAAKEAGQRKACTGLSESGGVGSANTSRGFTRLYLKPDQRDSGASDEETRLSNLAEHLNAKNELEHVFPKIIKSYKSPSDQTTHGSEDNYSDNVTKLDTNEASRTPDVSEQTQEEDATTVFTKDTENDLMNSPILDIIMEEDEEEMDAEVALVFTGEREVVKAGGEEEDFWLRWSNEERACVSAARDCCSPWQLAEGADTDREDNEEAVRWGVEKEGSSQTEVKVTVNNEENDKTNRNEEEKETVTETKEVMGKECKSETIRESKAEETQRGSAMANVETTDAAKGAKGLRFKKRTTTTTRTENGIGGIEKKKEVVEQVEKKKHIEESGGKKIEVTTEKKKVEVREERKKADVKEEKKKEVEEEKKKEAIEEEDKENGIAEDGGEKKKKKKKHRDSEDGERLRKKKKKKRDSEKENKKAAYQKRDDILEKHVGPRVRSFDAAKMKSKFEKPKQVSQVSSECRQCGKQVFQMEKIVAEKAAWHKNCFRCKECNCILTLETYQSHEGVLYCKPHFKELFRPKVVVEDPDEARKERLLRRPKLIVLESQPMELAEGVVRSTNKPDYGLEDLTHANLKQKFKMFEQISTEEDRVPDTIPVRRSQSLLTKAARFMQSDDDYGIENSELGEYDEDEEDEDYEEDEEEDDEEGEEGEDGKLNKSRAASFSGMKDLKAGFARKNRQDELTKKRRQELAKFRQMLCAGKNISTREIFEGGNEDEKGQLRRKEQIKIEGQIDAKNLRERFEKGLSVVESDSEESNDRREVDRVFKEAETASKARNLFKQIDKTVAEGGEVVLRPASSAQARRENRLSRDGKRIRNFTSQIFEDEDESDEEDERSSLADRFKFFATYEERAKEDAKRRKKLFRCSSDPDGEDQGIDMEELELGRDPNLVKCTDNYEDEVDCRGTRKLLAKFKKMEKQAEILDKEGEEDYDSDEEYSDDDESSDEEEEDSEEEDSEEEDSEEEDGKPKYKDEVLEMLVKSSQSAKKAASLRAKFEKWESEVERNNEYNQSIERYEDEDECMPSIDTARNLRAMFENKAQETTQPVGQRPKVKVNRFV